MRKCTARKRVLPWGRIGRQHATDDHLAGFALAARHSYAPSLVVIGRWLAEVNRRCPVCRGKAGHHQPVVHALQRDLEGNSLASRLLTQRNDRRQARPTSGRDAIEVAERTLREAARGDDEGDTAER